MMRTRLSEVIQVPDLVSVPAASDGARVSIQFHRRAWLVGLTVCALDNVDSIGARSSLAVAIEDAGQRAITLDGQAKRLGFVPMTLLAPGFGAGIAEATLPLVLPIEEDDVWSFTVRNLHATVAYTPAIGLILAPNEPGSPRPAPACSSLDACTRVITAPFPQLAAGEVSPFVATTFPEPGRVTGLRACALRNEAPRSDVGVELYDPECREMWTTDSRASVPISAALLAPGFEETMPLDIPRAANKRLRFRAQNFSAVNCTPMVALLWDGPFGGR